MALLSKENLAAMKAKREKFRLNHVGTKLNEAELVEFMALVEAKTDGIRVDPGVDRQGD